MKVLLISNSYLPVLGGLQAVVHILAQNLSRWGHDVRVVTNRYPRSLPGREVLDGVPVRRWPFLTPDFSDLRQGRSELFLASFYFCPSTLLRLTRLMQTFRPEVVNVHFPDVQVPFVLGLRRRFDFRLVVSLHGHEVERWFRMGKMMDNRQPIMNRLVQPSAIGTLRSVLQKADAVTACSRYLLDRATQLEPLIAQKGYVIHNGIDLERFQDKTVYSYPRPYILAFGRLTYKKGFDMLLEAFSRVAPQCALVDLILAGEGEERGALQVQVRRLGMDGRVHFFGRATPKEVVQLLNGCLFVVVPSRWEPFGIVALEALAAGKPVLATRVGGLPEFLEKIRGPSACVVSDETEAAHLGARSQNAGSSTVLVEPTVEELAEGLRVQLDYVRVGPVQRIADERLLEGYGWSHVVQRYEAALAGDDVQCDG